MLAVEITASPFGLFIAFLGGIVSILSPCVLPILPGLFSMVSGMTLDELRDDKKLGRRVIVLCSLFSAGFSLVYVIIGLATTQLSSNFIENSEKATQIGGAVLLMLAAFLAIGHLTQFRFFVSEKRPFFVNGITDSGAFITGAAFGFGWSPCIGPILAGVLTYAATENALASRVAIILFYCLGLCFALSAVVYASFRFEKVTNFLKRHLSLFVWLSIGIMTFFGLVLLFNEMAWVTANLTSFLDSIGLDGLVTIG
jgi:cytochrome c-type biogenesis protein